MLEMELKTEKQIDLTEFGGEGEVIMSPPTLRRTINMKNELGKCTRISQKNGEVSLENAPQGDMEVLGVLVYVEKAPFKTTVKDFLAYCDVLDEKSRGSAARLFDEMTQIAYDLDKGDASPLED